MTTFGSPSLPLDQQRYQAGWEAKMSGEWTGIFGGWTDYSWRSGWFNARAELRKQTGDLAHKRTLGTRPLYEGTYEVLTAIGVLMFLSGCWLSFYYQHHLPSAPVISLGRTYELDDHGSLVYMTRTESIKLHTLIFGGGLVAAIGIMPKVRKYRRTWKESR